ncbi:MAG: HlyD family efflux transporter periplasmic adaptor subunit, partial [Rhodospirillales bacterium]|nr:HlyD family efflux transporter periplasmic adaptor subunit [Rhodospirillales bacterium]
ARRDLEAAQAKGGGDAREVARLEAEDAHARLLAHERKLEMTEVRAPIAGVVVAAQGADAKPLARGRPAAQGELLVSIADFDRISVLTSVDEVDVGKIEAGQPAWISGPGFPDLRLEGAVAHVSSRASGGLRRRSTPQFEIVVALDRLDATHQARLRAGMSAHVTIVVLDRPAALMVPIAAVEQRDGRTWVRVLDRATGAVEERAVELGLTTLDSVEVVEGIEAGEEIVLSGS